MSHVQEKMLICLIWFLLSCLCLAVGIAEFFLPAISVKPSLKKLIFVVSSYNLFVLLLYHTEKQLTYWQ